MRALGLAIITVIGMGLTSSSYGAAICHQYILKVAKQLDACGKDTSCMEAPFKHAMNVKNYNTLYMSCKHAFDAEISDRLAAAQTPSLEQMEAMELEKKAEEAATLATQNTDINVSGNCNNAFYFLTYATKSCMTDKCVDQQYANTIKIPVFQHCSGPLVSVREARKNTLPALNYSYSYTPVMTAESQAAN
jgi:hypothetical protein